MLKFKNKRNFFLIKFIDSHIYFEILKKIRISIKLKQHLKNSAMPQSGTSTKKHSPELIVSLTSYPGRIDTVHNTIKTLLSQTHLPDKVILYLAEKQFPNKEKDLPETLLELYKYGLTIKWCEDLKSYKKLVPPLKEYPDAIIVTADDDLYYQTDWLESLYNAYLKSPSTLHTRRANHITFADGTVYMETHSANNHYGASYSHQLLGGAGCLFPPHSLHTDIFNIEQIKTLIPTHDDIYFWAMAVLAGSKINLISNKDLNIYQQKETSDSGLCKINNGKVSLSQKEALAIIFEKYPEILTKLERK